MRRSPLAFLSYVHADDKHCAGYITRLREALEGEVRSVTGDDSFAIFFDRQDIEWGQQWRDRLKDGIDGVALFLPVITPRYFHSKACREELERFLEHEKTLGRDDLVLPIYFITVDEMGEASTDPLMRAVAAHQYMDWRDLRNTAMAGEAYFDRLMRAGTRIKEILRSFGAPPAPKAPLPKTKAATMAGDVATAEGGLPPPPKEDSPLVVDAMGRGHFTTIGAAIAKAKPGARILVRTGYYEEALVIEKPLEIIGDGAPGDVVVANREANSRVVYSRAPMGRIANLTLRQMNKENACVLVPRGRIDIEDCDITSDGLSCVEIADGASPVLRRNRIHASNTVAILVHSGARGIVEENDICDNRLSGIEITNDSDPTITRNRIRNNQQAGLNIHTGGRGTIEDNDIAGNNDAGLRVKDGSDPTVRRNRIAGNREGICVTNASGRFIGNSFSGNTKAWDIDKRSADRIVRTGNTEE